MTGYPCPDWCDIAIEHSHVSPAGTFPSKKYQDAPPLRTWTVLMDIDRYDPDMGRTTVTVQARDTLEAQSIAKAEVHDRYPSACPLRAELAEVAA